MKHSALTFTSYTGKLSMGGYVGPEITVIPNTRTVVVDGSIAWEVRVGSEFDDLKGVSLEVRPYGTAKHFERANPLYA